MRNSQTTAKTSATPLTALKPDVPKCWLFLLSGLLWSGVGGMMCLRAGGWLAAEPWTTGMGLGMVGLVCAGLAFNWLFGDLARKNIRRLRKLPDRGCFFAFQAWTSYLIIAFMIALGIALRHSPIPKSVLAVAYTGIGGALFLASFSYYRHIARLLRVVRR